LAGNPSAAGTVDRLKRTISDVDETIRQVRTSIFELGSDGLDRGVRDNVLTLLEELKPVVGFGVRASFEGPVDTAIPDLVGEHLLATIREAITNVGRHAQATRTTVTITVSDGQCQLRVVDDGCGMARSESGTGGLGLGNLRRRAEKLHGSFDIESPEGGGTVLIWQVSLAQ
jgi:signal transduction histidine kinase